MEIKKFIENKTGIVFKFYPKMGKCVFKLGDIECEKISSNQKILDNVSSGVYSILSVNDGVNWSVGDKFLDKSNQQKIIDKIVYVCNEEECGFYVIDKEGKTHFFQNMVNKKSFIQ